MANGNEVLKLNIREFRKAMDTKFRDGKYSYDHDLFFNLVCHDGKFLTDELLSIFDKLCDTKEHAHIFFRCYPSAKEFNNNSYLISHWVYDQPEPSRTKRADAWAQIQEKLDEIVKKYYGVDKWGDQVKLVPARKEKDFTKLTCVPLDQELINNPNVKELISDTAFVKKYAPNRPIYINGVFIGYCKAFGRGQLASGYTRYYDEEDYRYYTNDNYFYTQWFSFHESTETIVNRISANKKTLKDLFLKVMFHPLETSHQKYDEKEGVYHAATYNFNQPNSNSDNYVAKDHPTIMFAGASWYNREDGLHINNIKNVTISEDRIDIKLPHDHLGDKNPLDFRDNSRNNRRSRYDYWDWDD